MDALCWFCPQCGCFTDVPCVEQEFVCPNQRCNATISAKDYRFMMQKYDIIERGRFVASC